MLPKIPKISCSLLAAVDGESELPEVLKELDVLGIDLIHYDVSENSKTLHLKDIETLRQSTRLPFDVHLSVSDPLEYLDGVQLKADDYFCVHVENQLTWSKLEQIRRQVGCNFGLAINAETPVSELFETGQILDYVLFMAATPGVSGGQFDDRVVNKIKSFRRAFPKVKVHVDGGVNHLSAALLRDLEVDVLISGSYILKNEDYLVQVVKLFGRNLYLRVADIMRSDSDVPRVTPETDIRQMMLEMDRKLVGCTCVVDENNHLVGLVTDGDVRRRLIVQPDLSALKAKDLMVTSPFAIDPDMRLLDLLRELDKRGAGFDVIPVVDASNSCLGLVWLRDILHAI
ncbi:MAG: CBS domain-containing protein [Cyanobacteria bacterium SID2]|nr:CBS domain-containing protein [Cyanobacteria bacterium SID2]MBP0005974.1 CBS domain-containing protein [Cyanobacteria bacterium SBC]